VNEIQFALQQSTVVDDVLSFIQMFSQISDNNTDDPLIANRPEGQPNVTANVKFGGLCVSATATGGATLAFDTRIFEFKIDSVGNAGESISIKAELDPIIVFGLMDEVSTANVYKRPELSHFDLHLSLAFEKTGSCVSHQKFTTTCESCCMAVFGYKFIVRVKEPSLYLPPEAVKSAVQFTWEYNQARLRLAKEVWCSIL
jgi:hypothetical protein